MFSDGLRCQLQRGAAKVVPKKNKKSLINPADKGFIRMLGQTQLGKVFAQDANGFPVLPPGVA